MFARTDASAGVKGHMVRSSVKWQAKPALTTRPGAGHTYARSAMARQA